jgi:uncharacterized membrane protein YcaP (DUF421 family)
VSQVVIVVFRGFFSFLSLLVLTHLMGKKQVSQLTFFEYVTGITIGSIASSLTVDLDLQLIPVWTGLLVWTLGTIVIGMVTTHSRPLAKLIEGEPTIVIQNGQILEKNMQQMNYTVDDLMMQLRQAKVFNIADVEFALLEPNGMLSVLVKSQSQPLTPRDLHIPTAYEGLSAELIVDGKIVEPNLSQLNLSREWLLGELAKRNHRLEDVYYAEIDTQGNLYIDLRDDLDGLPQEQDISETKVTGQETIKEPPEKGAGS